MSARRVASLALFLVTLTCGDSMFSCYHNNRLHQMLLRQRTVKASFLETSSRLRGGTYDAFACTKMMTADRCALAANFGAPSDRNCAWCQSTISPDVSTCVKIADVDFYEERDYLCAPHATRAQLMGGRPGVPFAERPDEDALIPRHHKSWGTHEFCSAVEVLFGGMKSFDWDRYPEVKSRVGDITFMDDAKETKISPSSMESIAEKIWRSRYPGAVFAEKCKSIFGDICVHQCLSLAALYDEAARPGVLGEGARDAYTADWEMDEGDFVQSKMAIDAVDQYSMEGGLVVQNKDMIGRDRVPAVRQVKMSGGEIKAPNPTRRMKYLMWKSDCVRCLDEDACLPECLSSEAPCYEPRA